jgi:hypothetical protein
MDESRPAATTLVGTNMESLMDGVSPLFQLSEYDQAGRTFIFRTVQELVTQNDEFLKLIGWRTVEIVPSHQVTAPSGAPVIMTPIDISSDFQASISELVAGDFDGLFTSLAEAARESAGIVSSNFLEYLGQVSDAFGQTVNAGGRPLSHDLLLDLLEKIDMTFDEMGRPSKVAWVMSRENIEKLKQLPPPTEDQLVRFDRIMDQKREDFNARKSGQRLS